MKFNLIKINKQWLIFNFPVTKREIKKMIGVRRFNKITDFVEDKSNQRCIGCRDANSHYKYCSEYVRV